MDNTVVDLIHKCAAFLIQTKKRNIIEMMIKHAHLI